MPGAEFRINFPLPLFRVVTVETAECLFRFPSNYVPLVHAAAITSGLVPQFFADPAAFWNGDMARDHDELWRLFRQNLWSRRENVAVGPAARTYLLRWRDKWPALSPLSPSLQCVCGMVACGGEKEREEVGWLVAPVACQKTSGICPLPLLPLPVAPACCPLLFPFSGKMMNFSVGRPPRLNLLLHISPQF